MHWTSFAPGVVGDLEECVNLDHGVYSSTNCVDEPHDHEALVARDRAMLLDLDVIADLVLVRLVVRLVALATRTYFL